MPFLAQMFSTSASSLAPPRFFNRRALYTLPLYQNHPTKADMDLNYQSWNPKKSREKVKSRYSETSDILGAVLAGVTWMARLGLRVMDRGKETPNSKGGDKPKEKKKKRGKW